MSETRARIDPCPFGGTRLVRDANVEVINHNPYPVEVTVRRVAEKVVYETITRFTGAGDGYTPMAPESAALQGKGFVDGQKVRVTIEVTK